MSYINLMFKDADMLIDGIQLPEEIIISLRKRGKSEVNFRYNPEDKTIAVKCSACQNWFPVMKLEETIWLVINDSYWVSRQKATNIFYYSERCQECYKIKADNSKHKPVEEKKHKDEVVNEHKTENISEKNDKKSDRVQETVALSKDNSLYLKVYSAINGKKKNDLLNQLIDDYRLNNPIVIE